MAPTIRTLFVASLLMLASCVHTFSKPTGLPADVNDRFSFHVNIEAQEKGLRTARSETGVTVYAPVGRITYGVNGDEIVAIYAIPNKSGVNQNYYDQKRRELETLSKELIDGARRRARDAQDFAY